MSNKKILLEVKDLVVGFQSEDGMVEAIKSISFTLYRGETVGIVGESGSGKSVTSLSIMRLIAYPPGKIISGEILYHTDKGTVIDITKLKEEDMRMVATFIHLIIKGDTNINRNMIIEYVSSIKSYLTFTVEKTISFNKDVTGC